MDNKSLDEYGDIIVTLADCGGRNPLTEAIRNKSIIVCAGPDCRYNRKVRADQSYVDENGDVFASREDGLAYFFRD